MGRKDQLWCRQDRQLNTTVGTAVDHNLSLIGWHITLGGQNFLTLAGKEGYVVHKMIILK